MARPARIRILLVVAILILFPPASGAFRERLVDG